MKAPNHLVVISTCGSLFGDAGCGAGTVYILKNNGA